MLLLQGQYSSILSVNAATPQQEDESDRQEDKQAATSVESNRIDPARKILFLLPRRTMAANVDDDYA
jgi:hypothetical protein